MSRIIAQLFSPSGDWVCIVLCPILPVGVANEYDIVANPCLKAYISEFFRKSYSVAQLEGSG
jgi:hypothetical protein